jgi:hypothetical protein
MPGSSEKAIIDEVQDRLLRKFEHLAPDQVSAMVRQAHAQFEQSKVRDFIPLLVERRATRELAEQSTAI